MTMPNSTDNKNLSQEIVNVLEFPDNSESPPPDTPTPVTRNSSATETVHSYSSNLDLPNNENNPEENSILNLKINPANNTIIYRDIDGLHWKSVELSNLFHNEPS
jgi:hypothetical protein